MGGSTPFEGMSHEAMLAWLDQANSGTVQGAADRLAAAAKEIRKIADDLKVRPQWVEWKGEGADAFRTWSADLANATLRLGDFSEGSSTWLGHASDAIASAQAAIPRDKPSAQGNLDAARKAHNDPDAAAISKKSAGELAALEADKEKVRQEAVAQMRKLGQAYQQSATQMNGLERPKFPPPPKAVAPPPGSISADSGEAEVRSGGPGRGAVSSRAIAASHPAQGRDAVSGARDPNQFSGATSPAPSAPVDIGQPARMDVDSVTSLPPAPQVPGATDRAPSPVGRADGGAMPGVGVVPPVFGAERSVPSGRTGPGRPEAGGRSAGLPGQGSSGLNPVRVPASDAGITGGRPSPTLPGRPAGASPGGTVVGAEGAGGRGPMGPATGFGAPGQAAGRPTGVPGYRSPAANGGVIGGRAQQGARVGARPSASAGAGAERGGISGGTPIGRTGGATSRESQSARSGRESGRTERPGYLTEDEATWQQGARRVVPPVIE
ncbi:translation initiation factor IF-2 [Streptomyces violascens]|uniref:translation initiation factor IF-2 n=1 Tax=Streptomyces violascens TaxID=67381 RepID=UPI003796AE94